jgi:putative flippase GtrA
MEKLKKLKDSKLVKKHGEKIRFLLVGGFNTVLDFCIYGLLANIIGVPQVISNIISTTICVTISFILNYKFVWHSEKSIKNTVIGFLAVSFFSAWVVQSVAISLTLAILGENATTNLIAKLVGSATGMITNYFGYKLVFKTRQK